MLERGGEKMEQFVYAQVLVYIIGTLIPVCGLYMTNKTKIKESEHRQTVQEMEIKHLKEIVEQNARRLDEHDEQNKTMFALVEQVRTLTKSIEELKSDVKSMTK